MECRADFCIVQGSRRGCGELLFIASLVLVLPINTPGKFLIPELKPQIPRFSQIWRELSGDERTNLFVAKLKGIDNRNRLTYPRVMPGLVGSDLPDIAKAMSGQVQAS
jgi:hypothetical protein